MEGNTVAFFGHRKVEGAKEMKNKIYKIVEELITRKNAVTFLFGSRSEFDSLCLEIVTELKGKYSHIKRVYVRAEYPYISNDYLQYLLKSYDETYYPDNIMNAGKSVYIERNHVMIDNSDFCVIYYDENYAPPRRKVCKNDVVSYQPKSGTKLAYEYALQKKVEMINVLSSFE